jgi:hypothetical protein
MIASQTFTATGNFTEVGQKRFTEAGMATASDQRSRLMRSFPRQFDVRLGKSNKEKQKKENP